MKNLNEVINEIANLPDEDKVFIKGKYYTAVDTRLQAFRKAFGSDAKVTTEMVLNDLERVVVKATISIYRDGSLREIGNDYAEEFRGQGMVNKTSALENCCTSAIGRALASCGLGGGEYASSFEVDNAINNKKEAPDLTKGFVWKNIKGNKISHHVDAILYLKELRKVIGEPSDKEHKKLYNENKEEILKAKASLKEDDKDYKAYAQLIGLYENDQQPL